MGSSSVRQGPEPGVPDYLWVMPSSPEKRKEYYQRNKHRWQNPDGSWKKSSSDRKTVYDKHYAKNKNSIQAKARAKTQKLREERTKPCPICEEVSVLVWDHDHMTGQFRDYICSSCNLALGHARDNPTILQNLIRYLNDHRTNEARR